MELVTLDGSEFDELDFEDPFCKQINCLQVEEVDEKSSPVTVYRTINGFKIGDYDYTAEKALKIALGYSVQNSLMDSETIEAYTRWFRTDSVANLMEDWINNILDDPDSFIIFADNFVFDDDNLFVSDHIKAKFKVEKYWVTLVDEDEYKFGEFVFTKDEIQSALKNYFHEPGDAEQVAETLKILDEANSHESNHIINYFFEWVADIDEFTASMIGHILDEREKGQMILKQYANINFVSKASKAILGAQETIRYERIGKDGYRINGYDYPAIYLLDKIIIYSNQYNLLDSLKLHSFKEIRETEYIHEAIEQWFEDYLDNENRFCDFLEMDKIASLYY